MEMEMSSEVYVHLFMLWLAQPSYLAYHLFGLPVQQISLLVIFIFIYFLFFIIGIYWIPFALMIFNDMSWILRGLSSLL